MTDETGGDFTGHLYVKLGDKEPIDTGLEGKWYGCDLLIPFHDEMTAEECARIISRALTREEDTNAEVS